MYFLSFKAMVLKLEPSILAFSSICLTSPYSENTFSQYMIWDPKDYSRDIAWVSSCLFRTSSYCIILLFPAVSATSASVCSTAIHSLIVINPPVVWVGAAVGWYSGDILADASMRAEIAACIGLKAFSAFIQDTAIYWDVDDLYSTIFFSMNESTGA